MEKEGELRKLKSELSELDRKISLTINKNRDDCDKEQGVKVDASKETKRNIANKIKIKA